MVSSWYGFWEKREEDFGLSYIYVRRGVNKGI